MISRKLLAEAFPNSPRLVAEFEDQSQTVDSVGEASAAVIAATTTMDAATVLTLSTNEAFANEYVVASGKGISLAVKPGSLVFSTAREVPLIVGEFSASFICDGDVVLVLPQAGHLATRGGVETLSDKTISAPKLTGIGNYIDDAAASTGGVPIGGMYRNGSVLMVRVA